MTGRVVKGVLVGSMVLWLAMQFGMSVQLLLERGMFVPVGGLILWPEGLKPPVGWLSLFRTHAARGTLDHGMEAAA